MPGDVGDGGGDDAEQQRSAPTRRPSRRPASTDVGRGRHLEQPDRRRGAASDSAPTTRPPAARAIGGRPLSSSADITKYVAQPTIAASDHSTPGRLRSAPESRSSTSTRPSAASTGADQGQPAGPLAVSQPQPHHDGGRRGVLDQQRRRDLHVRDGREVEELGGRHRDQAVDERRCASARAAGASGRAGPPSPNGATTTARRWRSRASTTAPGVQPLSSRPRASAPDMPERRRRDQREGEPRHGPRRTGPSVACVICQSSS